MMTIAEAAKRYPLSKSLLYELCKAGRLKHYRVGVRGRGKIIVDEKDLQAMLAECRVEGDDLADDTDLKFIR